MAAVVGGSTARPGSVYTELGGGYFTRLDPQKAIRRALRKLEQFGYTAGLASIENPN